MIVHLSRSCVGHPATQRGAATLIVAVVLITAVAAMAITALSMSTSNLLDSRMQDDSVAAFFLAESGTEWAIDEFANHGAICGTTLAGTNIPLGAGTMTIASSITGFDGATLLRSCQIADPSTCEWCRVIAQGAVRNAARRIEVIITKGTPGGTNGNLFSNPAAWLPSHRPNPDGTMTFARGGSSKASTLTGVNPLGTNPPAGAIYLVFDYQVTGTSVDLDLTVNLQNGQAIETVVPWSLSGSGQIVFDMGNLDLNTTPIQKWSFEAGAFTPRTAQLQLIHPCVGPLGYCMGAGQAPGGGWRE